MLSSAVLCLALLGQGEVIDRIVAVVEGRPVTLSDVRVVQRVRGASAEAAVQALIDERLMFREASRLPQAAATEEEVTQALSELHVDDGVSPRDVRRLLRRQITILKYVDHRFRPEIRITDEELRARYDREAAADPATAPPEPMAEALRERLAAEALDRRIEDWVRELRAGASIRLVPPP